MPNPAYQFRFVVDAAHHGLRIDTFLASRLRNHAPARMLRLVRAGLVRVDDLPCGTDRRVRRGEEIAVLLAEPPEPFYSAEPCSLDILYDDPWLLVINKPAGMLAHPAGPVGGGTVANGVQAWLDGRTRFPGLQRPGIVHRLDRETSGVMLVPKDSIAHACLTRQFERRVVYKTYCALVHGHVSSDSGTIDLAVGNISGHLTMTTAPGALAPRSARTAYRILHRLRSTTLLLAQPLTGRKHQIRVHLAAQGHPIVGDAVYGRAPIRRPPAQRHALHAVSTVFRHPVTNAPMRVDAPLPPDFWETLRVV